MAKGIQRCLGQASVHTLYINKARPWENGYVESFNGNLRDELLNRKLFLGLDEARYVLDHWLNAYNHHRPHSGIGWQTPTASAVSMNDADMTFPSATLADPPVGAAPLPLDLPAQSTPILSHKLVQKS